MGGSSGCGRPFYKWQITFTISRLFISICIQQPNYGASSPLPHVQLEFLKRHGSTDLLGPMLLEDFLFPIGSIGIDSLKIFEGLGTDLNPSTSKF